MCKIGPNPLPTKRTNLHLKSPLVIINLITWQQTRDSSSLHGQSTYQTKEFQHTPHPEHPNCINWRTKTLLQSESRQHLPVTIKIEDFMMRRRSNKAGQNAWCKCTTHNNNYLESNERTFVVITKPLDMVSTFWTKPKTEVFCKIADSEYKHWQVYIQIKENPHVLVGSPGQPWPRNGVNKMGSWEKKRLGRG
jgi:hypothetical protein